MPAILRKLNQASPVLRARLAGLFYLLIFLAAPSGALSATPLKMTINLACDIAVALLLYDLLRPVSRSLSLLAALFRLIFVVVMGVNSLNYIGVTALFQPAHSASAFDLAYGMALVPFGIHCVLIGCLIFRSAYLPRFLGVLMVLAGMAYLIFLSPRLGSRLFLPWIVVPGVLGEGSLTLWLLTMGVSLKRWKQRENLQLAKTGVSE
jgi:hypothetical protein